ncbi:MAG: VOC family protein [Rhodospirillales bacterium]|nr:VOC family protein [Rhodospirillales bacterium]
MIDHVSIGVRDLVAAGFFYDATLATLEMTRLYDRPDTIGYGKEHPEFWLNARDDLPPPALDTGVHVCLRARSTSAVDAFYAAGLSNGATDDGPPGLRPQYDPRYYAAFLRDPDGNRIEAIHFAEAPA